MTLDTLAAQVADQNKQLDEQNKLLNNLERRVAAVMAKLEIILDDASASNEKTPKNTKKNKKDKDTSDDDKPKKKRVSGYLLFSSVHRDEVKQELFGDDKPKNSEIMVELGKRWKALDDEEREEWGAKAKAKANETDQ